MRTIVHHLQTTLPNSRTDSGYLWQHKLVRPVSAPAEKLYKNDNLTLRTTPTSPSSTQPASPHALHSLTGTQCVHPLHIRVPNCATLKHLYSVSSNEPHRNVILRIFQIWRKHNEFVLPLSQFLIENHQYRTFCWVHNDTVSQPMLFLMQITTQKTSFLFAPPEVPQNEPLHLGAMWNEIRFRPAAFDQNQADVHKMRPSFVCGLAPIQEQYNYLVHTSLSVPAFVQCHNKMATETLQ